MPFETKRRFPIAEVDLHTLSGTFTFTNHEPDTALVSINTSKSMGAAAGNFTVVFKGRTDAEGLDIYEKLQPMDMIEIRMSDDPKNPLKVIMRGFIDEVKKSIVAAGEKINLNITVSGRDYGKLLLVHRAYYFKFMASVDQFFAIMRYGIETDEIRTTIPNIYKIIFERIFFTSSNLAYTNNKSIRDLIELRVTAGTIGENSRDRLVEVQVAPMFDQEGSIWSLFQMYQNAPFNELFLRDEDDVTRLILRPALLKDRNNDFTQTLTTEEEKFFADDIEGIKIAIEDILVEDISRSDMEVKTFYYVYPKDINAVKESHKALSATPTGFFSTFGEDDLNFARENPFYAKFADDISDKNRYGIRPFEIDTNYMVMQKGATREVLKFAREDAVIVGNIFNKILTRNYLHNPWLESGSMVIAGNQNIRIGQYLRVGDPTIPGGEREFYVEGVTQSFGYYDKWVTNLRLTRGNGWMLKHSTRELTSLQDMRRNSALSNNIATAISEFTESISPLTFGVF